MFNWSGSYQLGVDLGSKNLKFVELSQKQASPYLENWGLKKLPTSEAEIIDLLVQIKAQYDLNTKRVVLNSSGEELILKRINISGAKASEEQIINQKVKAELPLPIEEMIVDYELLSTDKNQKELLLAAVRRGVVLKQIELLSKAGFKVVSVVPGTLLLKNLLREDERPQSNWAVLDLGAEQAELVVFAGRQFVFHRCLQLAGNKFTAEIQEKRKISCQQAEELKQTTNFKQELLTETMEKLVMEINRSFQYHNLRIDRLLLTGGAAKLRQLTDWLETELSVNTGLLNSLASFQFDPAEFDPHQLRQKLPQLAVSLSLALKE